MKKSKTNSSNHKIRGHKKFTTQGNGTHSRVSKNKNSTKKAYRGQGK